VKNGTYFAYIVIKFSYRLKVSKIYNTNIQKVLKLTRDMMVLADEGDSSRQDRSCGVLYGTLRDTAYKVRDLAQREKSIHIESGLWDIEED